jgi:hypothetical protein
VLADLLLYSYEADFIQRLLQKNQKKLARSINSTFRYIDDVLSLNNSRFDDFVNCIYPIQLEINDTTDTERSASYLDRQAQFKNTSTKHNTFVVNQKLGRNRKLWNIVSTEIYILHTHVNVIAS